MTTGLLLSWVMCSMTWSARSPIVLPANTLGSAFASSTVAGSPGQSTSTDREAGLFEQFGPARPAGWEEPEAVEEDHWGSSTRVRVFDLLDGGRLEAGHGAPYSSR